MGELFHRFDEFSIRGCLELLSRTARAIAGHPKEDLGGCIRQIHTHLRRLCPGLRSFGSFRLGEVFFFKTKFYLSISESSEKFLGNPPSSSVDRANDLRFGKGRNRRVQI